VVGWAARGAAAATAVRVAARAGRSLTASVCTGAAWQLTVGAIGHQIECGGGLPITPDGCWCPNGQVWSPPTSTPSHDCAAFDGGTRDAPASD